VTLVPAQSKRVKSLRASQDAWAVISRFGLERVDGERHGNVTAASRMSPALSWPARLNRQFRLWRSGTGTAFCAAACPCGADIAAPAPGAPGESGGTA
jgi:hypothetical protein